MHTPLKRSTSKRPRKPAATPAQAPSPTPAPSAVEATPTHSRVEPAPSATPLLDAVEKVLEFAVSPVERWAVVGWAHHIRETKHQNHAANSYAKHARDFPEMLSVARAVVIARCGDFGVTPEDASELMRERVMARAKKIADEA